MPRIHYGQEKERGFRAYQKSVGEVDTQEKVTKPIVLVGTPYYENVAGKYVISLMQTRIDLYDRYDIRLATTESSQVHVNRNTIWHIAYDAKVPYLLYIDSDMIWKPKDVERLLKSSEDKEVISGLCTTRKQSPAGNYHYCVYESDGTGRNRPMMSVPKVPFRCWAVGAAFMLIRRPIIVRMWEEKMKHGYPFDLMQHGLSPDKSKIESSFLGEDISFCTRLRKLNIDIWCDPAVKPIHIGEALIGAADDVGEVK